MLIFRIKAVQSDLLAIVSEMELYMQLLNYQLEFSFLAKVEPTEKENITKQNISINNIITSSHSFNSSTPSVK